MARSRRRDPRSGARGTATSWPQRLALVAFGLALAAAGAALLEAGLRLLRVGEEAAWADPFVGIAAGGPLFERRERAGGDVLVTADAKLPYFNYQELAARKPAGGYRIFALGGSTTAGRPYDDRVSFSAWLRRYLPAADPSRPWEVVNAGAISYASYRVVLLMQELVRYEPDMFLVYTGHNEFLEERTYPAIAHGSALRKRLWLVLNSLRSYSLARRWWRRQRGPATAAGTTLAGEVSALPDDWTGIDRYRRDPELERAVTEHFAHNLRRMDAIARAHDVRLVFVAPVSNLKDFSPFRSQPSDGLPPGERARFDELLARGRQELAAGRSREAVVTLLEAAHLDPLHAEGRFRLGRALLELGEHQRARQELVAAKEQDVVPLRAREPIVRQVGEFARRSSLALVDLPQILAADSRRRLGHDILGNEYLLDHVHPDIPVHSRVAEEVLEVLAAAGVVRRRPGWSEAEREAIYRRALDELEPAYYAERDLNLAKVLGWAGKTEEAEVALRRAAGQLAGNAEVHLNLGILLQKQRRWSEAEAELERALELDPASPEAWFNLGVTRAGSGSPQEAAAALRRALELRPGYSEALYNLGVVERRTGSPERAVETLERALAARPGAVETLVQLGLARRALGRLDAAATAFEQALAAAPGRAAAAAGLGSVELARGRSEAAERLLRQAVERDPELADAHFQLARLAARRGDREAAIAAYRRAVEIDPRLAQAHNNLGILLAEAGRLEEARQALARALEADPGFAEAYFNLGVVYDRAGLAAEAVAAIGRALELDPANGRFNLAMGLILAARGDGERAAEHLRRAEAAGLAVPPAASGSGGQ